MNVAAMAGIPREVSTAAKHLECSQHTHQIDAGSDSLHTYAGRYTRG